MSDVVVPMVGSCLLLVFGIMIYRGKLTGLLAGMSLLSGERLEEAKRTAESLGANRVVGGVCSFLRNMPFSLVPFSGQKGYSRPDGGCRYNRRACLCK